VTDVEELFRRGADGCGIVSAQGWFKKPDVFPGMEALGGLAVIVRV